MKRYSKYAKPYWSALIFGPLPMLAEVLGEIMLPKPMSLIINSGVANCDLSYIITVGVLVILATPAMAIGGTGGAHFSAKASINFAGDLREDLFAKVQAFSFKNTDIYSTGSLVTRLTDDIQQIQNVMMMALRMMSRVSGLLVGALIMVFLMNAGLAVIVLTVIPLLTLVAAIILKTAFPRSTTMQKKLDRLNSGIQEALTSARVIKSFVREDYEEEKFKDMNLDLKKSSLRAMNIVIATMPVIMLTMNITTLAVVRYGGNIIIAGGMQVGDLMAFITYIVQILMSLMMLFMIFLQNSRAMTSVKRINEVVGTEIGLTGEHATRKDLKVTEGRVEFKNVSFSYENDGDEKVLEHTNPAMKPDQTIGIIGVAGSGKITLVQMIPRLYNATEGQVLVDDVDVREYSLGHLREGVDMVLQKNVLFSGTIEENLRWGDENATDEEIRAMAESVQADSFAQSFINGYQTNMGRGGVNVPGGQKQRLCIVRALLKKPKILTLDDSISVVDTATEAKIRECFQTTLKVTTKLIAAQQIGSVEGADEITVLDGGKIIGMGTHDELPKNCEAYREIYYSQRGREETTPLSVNSADGESPEYFIQGEVSEVSTS